MRDIQSSTTQPPVQFWKIIKFLNSLKAGLQYIRTWILAQKTAVFGCLTNALAPAPIALESCSRTQTDRPV